MSGTPAPLVDVVALQASADCVAIISTDWTISFLNGKAVGEIAKGRNVVGLSVFSAFSHLISPASESAIRTVMRDRIPRWIEVHDPGHIVWYDAVVAPWPEGGLVMAFRDVSAVRQAREALNETVTRLELALRAGSLGIWDWDLTTNTFNYSEEARRVCGFPKDGPVTYEMVVRITHPDDLPRTAALARSALDPALRSRDPFEYRILRHDDGVERWVAAHGHAVFDEARGVAVRYIGTIQDITWRKATEAAALENESRLSLAIEAGRMAVWSFDIQAEHLEVSPELKRVLGFPQDARVAREDLERGYLPGEQARVRAAGAAALASGNPFFEVEYQYRRPDGDVRWLMMRAQITLSPQGSPARVLGVVLDVTDRVDAETQRQLIADEMSHRARNAFALVTSIAQASLPEGPARERFLERIRALAEGYAMLLATGEGCAVSDLLQRELAPYGAERFRLSGPACRLHDTAVVSFGLLIHELASNAAKYGALSVPGGEVHVAWRCGAGTIEIEWRERGGPEVASPKRRGFGSRLIDSVLTKGLGQVRRNFGREGVVATITLHVDVLPRDAVGDCKPPSGLRVAETAELSPRVPADGRVD